MSKWTDEQAIRAHESAAGYDPETQRIMAGRRILDLEAALAAMRPVVEAAELWSESWAPGLLDATLALNAAVDAYRAQREGK